MRQDPFEVAGQEPMLLQGPGEFRPAVVGQPPQGMHDVINGGIEIEPEVPSGAALDVIVAVGHAGHSKWNRITRPNSPSQPGLRSRPASRTGSETLSRA